MGDPTVKYLFAVAILICQSPVLAFEGRVVGVTDGDTVKVLADGGQLHRVRMLCIDAPEKRQAWGVASKNALARLVFDKRVTVVEFGRDRYGRVLGDVEIQSISANKMQVMSGHAWTYRSYCKDPVYSAMEDDARKKRRGLWSDGVSPVPPWEFRREGRK